MKINDINKKSGKLDFPFYDDNPKLSVKQWLVLFAGVVIFVCFIIFPNDNPIYLNSILMFLIMFIPVTIVTKGKLGYLFKMPKLKDLVLVIFLLIGYLIYSIIMITILSHFGIETVQDQILNTNMDFITVISILFQLVGEELIKIIPFLMITHILYKYSQNRKLSIAISLIIILIFFGLMHYEAYSGNIAQIILIIGFGSFFNMLAYLKTKNATVSYLYHLILDIFPILLTLLI